MTSVGLERRTHRRIDVAATAIVLKHGVDSGRYLVQNLSAAGALLTGGDTVEVGDSLLVRIEMTGRTPVVVGARVVRSAKAAPDMTALAVEFKHSSPDTEDAIHEAVLDALEEAVKSEPFFKDVDHYA